MVLIHLGTNDQENFPHASTVQNPLREFITFLRHQNPVVAILLGHLNFNLSEGASAIRPLVQSLADELNRPEAPIQTIPHEKGWIRRFLMKRAGLRIPRERKLIPLTGPTRIRRTNKKWPIVGLPFETTTLEGKECRKFM